MPHRRRVELSCVAINGPLVYFSIFSTNSVSVRIIIRVTTCVRMIVFRQRHRPTMVLPLVYCPADDTFVRSQLRNPLFCCVKSLLLLWKPHSWFSANLKNFLLLSIILRIDRGLAPPKIITESCELVKSGHINRRNPHCSAV